VTVLKSITLTVALSLGAAVIGAWLSAAYLQAHLRGPPPLHELLHRQLQLTAEQERRISVLERDYLARRQSYEVEIRAANADLAGAYRTSHAFTGSMQAAIDRSHAAMAGLQRETMLHVIDMRAVLAPGQAARFDDQVVKSLTSREP
jgi:hypothetical protein